MPRWVPSEMEWLLMARTDGSRAFMRILPQGDDRDAIVAMVRERVGTRWLGDRLELTEARRQLGISSRGDTLKVVGIIAGVLGLVFVLLLLLALLAHPLFAIPAGFVAGGWLFRRGLDGLRDALSVRNTPTAKARSAAMGWSSSKGRR